MGNRGILHDDQGSIVRHWASSTWVTCLTQFRDRASPGAFRPGHYSKLFFLDEATAFAAGHRPCGECQRSRYLEFREAWKAANVTQSERLNFSVKTIDQQLHAERVARMSDNRKLVFSALVADMPFGVIVEWAGSAWLVTAQRKLCRWSFDGYTDIVDAPQHEVGVLTPASVVRTYSRGFVPEVHPSGR